MEKLGMKIPLLLFFLGIVYFVSEGTDVMDAVIRAFIFAFGVALIILVVTLLLVFFNTLNSNRGESSKIPVNRDSGKKVEMHA